MKEKAMSADPYREAFFDSVDKLDILGERAGTAIKRGGWKLAVIIVTGLAITLFGIAQLVQAFGRGLFKSK